MVKNTVKTLSSSQIALIMKDKKAYNSAFFLLKIKEQNNSTTQKNTEGSFVASTKTFAKAVDRNKAKRRLKEAFLEAVKESGEIAPLPFFVFLAKKETINANFSKIVEDVKQIFLKNYIINK